MVGQALPSPPRTYLTSKVVHSSGGNSVVAGPQAAQANLPEAWVLTLVLSLSPKPLSQHIPEAATQTPPPMAHPSFSTPARATTQVGPGRLVALWACIVLAIGGMASGGSGVRKEVGAKNPLSIWGMSCPSPAKCHHGQGCHAASASA